MEFHVIVLAKNTILEKNNLLNPFYHSLKYAADKTFTPNGLIYTDFYKSQNNLQPPLNKKKM